VPDERIETQLPSSLTTGSSARAFLRAVLQTWRLDGFGEVTELLTDELVSNVVRHVAAPMTLRVLRHGSCLRVEVDDPSTARPRVLHPDEEATSGRGLLLVDALAAGWGTDLRSDGKTVWFELDVSTAAEEMHGA
jgi:anti-sigma regulatory factor (Ser/Thr protein kinase)